MILAFVTSISKAGCIGNCELVLAIGSQQRYSYLGVLWIALFAFTAHLLSFVGFSPVPQVVTIFFSRKDLKRPYDDETSAFFYVAFYVLGATRWNFRMVWGQGVTCLDNIYILRLLFDGQCLYRHVGAGAGRPARILWKCRRTLYIINDYISFWPFAFILRQYIVVPGAREHAQWERGCLYADGFETPCLWCTSCWRWLKLTHI